MNVKVERDMAEPPDLTESPGIGPLMTVGALAEHVGKSARALRLYEEMGLLVPRGRSCGNYREYGPEALVRLRWILRLHDLGLPLSEIKGFLDDVAGAANAGDAMASVRERYSRTLECVEAQIAKLQSLQQGLVESVKWLEACGGCESQVSRLAESCTGCERQPGDHRPELVRGVNAQIPNPGFAPCGGKKETP